MSGSAGHTGKFGWQESLSANEILTWYRTHRKPVSLESRFSVPGVYRFVFPEFKDEQKGTGFSLLKGTGFSRLKGTGFSLMKGTG